jgi:Fic family protein
MTIEKTTKPEEVEFLKESNAIEGVYDDKSLQQAIYAWEYLKKEKKLTQGVVLRTHKILMLHQPLMPNEKGYYRTCPVYIGGREGVRWEHLNLAMDEWLVPMNQKPQFVVDNWKKLHVDYEKIHPFVDGNGRTGRMFMNWYRLKGKMPVLVIKESEKYAYYDWFK